MTQLDPQRFRFKHKGIGAVLGLLGLIVLFPLSAHPQEAKAQRDERMHWWKEAKLGLFIHWGLYAIPAGEWAENQEKHPFLGTEWIMAYRKIPVAEYRKLAQEFYPAQFDAESWVVAAKNAGMKYIVLTAKHHDGFALFDSDVGDFDVVEATPFKRDIVKELAEACQKHEMKLGLYYSQAQDWSHRGGAVASFTKPWDAGHAGDFAEYVDQVAIPQVKEILSKYGPIAVIWWDTPENMTPEIAAKFETLLSMQSGIISNSRLFKGGPGDFQVFEGKVPASGVPGTPWEVCVMMNESWGYSRVHHDWSDAELVIRQVIQTAGLGGNFLLNVGPDASGVFPPEAVSVLEALGEWMKVNGEAIYGTTGFPTKKIWQQGRITQKPGKLYASVYLWPPNGKLMIPVNANVKRVSLLSNPDINLEFTLNESGVMVNVPQKIPTPGAGVLVMEIDGKATEATTFPALSADSQGCFDLLVAYANLLGPDENKPGAALGKREGATPALTRDPAEGFKVGGFGSPLEHLDWRIDIPKAGKYTAVAYAGVQKNVPPDLSVTLRSGSQSLTRALVPTGDSQNFKPIELGVLDFETSGQHIISLSADLKDAQGSVCNFWRVQLLPVAESQLSP